MPSPPPTLTELFRAYLAERTTARHPVFDRENARAISRLKSRDITTNSELVSTLPTLPTKLKLFGIWWLEQMRPPGTERVLLQIFKKDSKVRLTCASTLGWLRGRRTVREFMRIGRQQLSSAAPDLKWLEAIIPGLQMCNDDEAGELLVSIYERTDLPGWLRGDAGDALGCVLRIRDRRTREFRRVWSAAQRGLHEPDIEVVFWSMYVIMQLATNGYDTNRRRSNRGFESVLPRLREIAETDHRLAPGFWWPMCEEAKDAIEVIETGNGPIKDAGDRWLGHPERGPCVDRG